MEVLDTALSTLVYLASCFFLFFIGKVVYQLFHRKINVKDELVEKDNLAFAVAHTGYFVGLLLAIGSAIIGPSMGMQQDLIDIFVYGLLAIILLNLSIFINDKLILRKFSVYKEIVEDRNVGTGVIEGANSVATGLILLGAISGDGSILTALIFWAIGQVLLLVTELMYNLITPYDIHEHIEKDNVAVGIGFAGAMISIGNVIRFALMHDFVSWEDSMINIAINVGIGLLFLPLVRILTDKILLPGQKLTDEIINQEHPNHGAALIEAFAYIGGSVLITWTL
ncbi:MAG: DUF350 domain-containing protein [Bacteroidetes bacterium]|nr:DUF350 domain-containing protein [Bacteroidota bacterium]MCZ6899352.1 DUF350 domain-containing protein [Bacteroidota bacterium]